MPTGVYGRKPILVACRWCGARITLTERWHGRHAGCTRVVRKRAAPEHNQRADPALLALAERELEAFWLAEGWGVRPPSVVE